MDQVIEREPPSFSLSSLVRMMASEMAVLERWIGGGGEYFAAADRFSPWMRSNKSQLLACVYYMYLIMVQVRFLRVAGMMYKSG